MTDKMRIRELLEEILESRCTPEEACAEYPELLPEVCARLKRFRSFENHVDELFPSSKPAAADVTGLWARSLGAELPQIEGYHVEGILGRGGMGVVYRARHLKLKRMVALKMMLSGAYASRQEFARFVHEAEAVAGLQHPHIVQVYDVGELEGRPYFTMEFIDGGSLAQEVAKRPHSAACSARLVGTLASAVEFAHQHGIVHRDLKPANILLTADHSPKIADFGLARRFEGGQELTMSGARIGTPSYMAPEQALGKTRAVGPAVDIYALGAILYELLTGRPPFHADTALETQRQVIAEDPAPPSRLNASVPRDLETICLKCLHKEPERRYVSAVALAEDLQRFVEGRPIHARPLGWGARLWRWCRRKPTAAALVATALMLAGLALGGGLWLEQQKAEQRAETARQEGRAWQAIEAALVQAAALQEQGRWPEARATLVGAESLLDSSTPDGLRQRLRQARADAEMVAGLEEIRLRLSDGRKSHETELSPEGMYAEAFRNYGIALMTLEPGAAAARVRDSAIRDTLLAFLHDWLHWVSNENRDHLQDVLDRADDNEWRRAFRKALAAKDAVKLHSLARAPEAPAQPPVVLSGLGGALFGNEYRNEALALLREAQRRHPGDFWINYLLGNFLHPERPQEAVGYFRVAVAIRPSSDQAYLMLGRALRDIGDADGAIASFRKAIALNSNYAVAKDLARAVAPKGGLEEVRAIWEKILDRDPPNFDPWYGYAQLCLFLGNEEAYRRARQALLKRFGDTGDKDWTIAERTSLACLLLPDSGDDLRRAVELVNRAVAAGEASRDPANPYLLFVKGLAEYRQGRPEQAIPLLQESAVKLPNRAGPRLVLAMAQFQSGSKMEARKTLAVAVRGYNWKASHAGHTTVWVSHVLRREAEAMILPNLLEFIQGKYQPQDNDERLALLGICQFKGLDAAAARLFADAFAADPDLAVDLTTECLHRAAREEQPVDRIDVLNTECRYLAARCAALAGCGQAKDGATLSDAERIRWRKQAREWLQADLAVWARTLDYGPGVHPDVAKKMLTQWQVESDLAGLREMNALDQLSADERKECLALWKDIRARLNGTTGP